MKDATDDGVVDAAERSGAGEQLFAKLTAMAKRLELERSLDQWTVSRAAEWIGYARARISLLERYRANAREQIRESELWWHRAESERDALASIAAVLMMVVKAARRVNERRIAHGRDGEAETELHDCLAALDAWMERNGLTGWGTSNG